MTIDEINNLIKMAHYSSSQNILEFKGDYRYLSNMYKVFFRIDGTLYLSVEHWYQANKTTNPDIYDSIRKCSTPYEAKTVGNQIIEIRPDWDDIKLDIMYKGVHAKFSQNRDLKSKLLSTRGLLVEGNTWGDQYWGICKGIGENHLGKILVRVREELRGL